MRKTDNTPEPFGEKGKEPTRFDSWWWYVFLVKLLIFQWGVFFILLDWKCISGYYGSICQWLIALFTIYCYFGFSNYVKKAGYK